MTEAIPVDALERRNLLLAIFNELSDAGQKKILCESLVGFIARIQDVPENYELDSLFKACLGKDLQSLIREKTVSYAHLKKGDYIYFQKTEPGEKASKDMAAAKLIRIRRAIARHKSLN